MYELIQLKEPQIIKPHFVLSIASPRGSGKTTLVTKLIKETYKNVFHYIVFMSASLDVNGDYLDITNDYLKGKQKPDKEYIYRLSDTSEFHTIIEEIIDSNTSIKKDKEYECPSVLVVCDDAVDSRILQSKQLLKIASRGRHINISLIISTQYITSIARAIRVNSTGFIVFKPFSYTETERFMEEFIQRKYKRCMDDLMSEVFDEPYAFFFINNENKKASERVYVGFDKRVRFYDDKK